MKEEKELSHRQRQRARKRLLKKQNLNKKLTKLEKTKSNKKEIEDTLTEDVSFLLFFFIIKSYIDCFRSLSSNFINIFGRSQKMLYVSWVNGFSFLKYKRNYNISHK